MATKNKKKEKDIQVEEQVQETVEETTKTNEQVEETEILTKEEQLEEDLAKEKDKFLRLFAEFENFKKRTSKERIELFKTAGQDIMVAMLPVLDDFDRALSEISKSGEGELVKGVELISNKFRETLKAKGLTEMEVKAGDVFDADHHEAITQIPAPNDDLKGKIVDIIEKGYQLGDKIIRFPKVVTGQ